MRQRIYQIIDTASPHDKLSAAYDYLMMTVIIISVIPLCFKHSTVAFIWFDRVTVTIFILDYLLRWFTADLKFKHWGKKAFLFYPFTAFAIIDLMSILPAFLSLHASFKLLRLLRLGKVARILKILRYSKSFDRIIKVMKREKQALLAVCYLTAGYIIISSLIMFSIEPESFNSFFDAIYWSVVTVTTVGYGDIYPVSDLGRFFSMISALMGIAIVALPTGIITAGYMNELNSNNGDE